MFKTITLSKFVVRINYINIYIYILAEVFVSIAWAFYPRCATSYIYMIFKQNKVELFISHKICCSINVQYKVYICSANIDFRGSE